MDPIPAPEPEAPNRGNVSGNALCDLDHPVVTFAAYDRATGAKVVLDDRTFDPALHSLDPVAV